MLGGGQKKVVIGGVDRQVTSAPHGHVLTNAHVWSPDSRWLTFDVRSDAGGVKFDGDRICAVHVGSGQVRTLYTAPDDAKVGVSMFRNTTRGKQRGVVQEGGDEVVFIHGPENPSDTWSYSACHRRGALVDATSVLSGRGGNPGKKTSSTPSARNLDARDLLPPFTPGALRGGTHVHQFSPDGMLVSSTYEDHVLQKNEGSAAERNYRGIALTVLDEFGGVRVSSKEHPRNHSGEGFTVLATRHEDEPTPGGDDIARGVEEAWIGDRGYCYERGGGGGCWQSYALAFLGEVTTTTTTREEGGDIRNKTMMELFILDLPENASALREATGPRTPLQGTSTTRPHPPHGVSQRRLTDTSRRKRPGLCQGGGGGGGGPRFWPRSSRCGSVIAVVALDDDGVPQLYTVRTAGARGEPLRPVTRLPSPGVESAFTWHPTLDLIAFVHDGSVCVAEVPRDHFNNSFSSSSTPSSSSSSGPSYGGVTRLTRRRVGEAAPRPEACVFSPCGRYVAYVRRVYNNNNANNASFKPPPTQKNATVTGGEKRWWWWWFGGKQRRRKERREVFDVSSSAPSGGVGGEEGGRRSRPGEEREQEEGGEWHNQIFVVALKWGKKAPPPPRMGTGMGMGGDEKRRRNDDTPWWKSALTQTIVIAGILTPLAAVPEYYANRRQRLTRRAS